jgi:FRG domain
MKNAFQVVSGPSDGEKFTADSFLDYLRPSKDHWWMPGLSGEQNRWVFRGHQDASWKLVPSIARKNADERYAKILAAQEAILEKIQLPPDLSAEKLRARRLVAAYVSALKNFKNLAETLILSPELPNVPDYDLQSFVTYDGGSYMEFEGPATLAQHHGLPTFLLDWTARPEIAASFAVDHGQQSQQTDIAVFALLRTKAPVINPNTANGAYEFIEGSKFSNTYLNTQQGVFTRHQGHQVFMATGDIVPLEDVISGSFPAYDYKLLLKIVLEKSQMPRLRELLARENLTKAHLMPTLDNVSQVALASLLA